MLKIRIYFYNNYHVICFIPLKKKRWNYRYTKEKLIHYDGGNIPASRIPMSSMSPVLVLRTNTFYRTYVKPKVHTILSFLCL